VAALPRCCATYNSSLILGFGWSFYGTFSAWRLRRDSPAASNLESFGQLIFLAEPWTVRLQSVLCDAREAEKWWETSHHSSASCLKRHNFVTFRCISTKLDDKVYGVYLKCMKFNSREKNFMQKFSRTAEISTEVAVDDFYVHPGKGNWQRCNRLDPAVKNTVKVHRNQLYVL